NADGLGLPRLFGDGLHSNAEQALDRDVPQHANVGDPPTHPISSSPRVAAPSDASLRDTQRGCCTGPMRLPVQNQRQFVDEFNATYASTGMQIHPDDDDDRDGRTTE
ncbi:MAG: hypothetical protein AAFP90_23860, partial [Planctomycetota bacterium]